MAKKPEDEFIITDEDIAGINSAGKTNEVEVDPVEEEPEEPAVIETKPKPAAVEASDSLQEQLEALRKQNEELETEKARREAELAKELASERAKTAKQEGELTDSRLQTISNAMAVNESAQKDAKTRYAQALQEGDFSKAADIQGEIADLAVNHKRLDEGKNAIELQIERDKEAPPKKPSSGDALQDMFDNFAPEARTWAMSHRDQFATPARLHRVSAAHFDALEHGLRENSQQYFDHIETALGLKADPEPQPVRQQPRQNIPPAAPVSRTNGGSTSVQRMPNGKIRLPAPLVEAAQISGLTPREYWEAMTPEERSKYVN